MAKGELALLCAISPFCHDVFKSSLLRQNSSYRWDSVTNRVLFIMLRDETPTYDEGDTNKMIYILFNRQFVDDDILIFIKPNTTELVNKLYEYHVSRSTRIQHYGLCVMYRPRSACAVRAY